MVPNTAKMKIICKFKKKLFSLQNIGLVTKSETCRYLYSLSKHIGFCHFLSRLEFVCFIWASCAFNFTTPHVAIFFEFYLKFSIFKLLNIFAGYFLNRLRKLSNSYQNALRMRISILI